MLARVTVIEFVDGSCWASSELVSRSMLKESATAWSRYAIAKELWRRLKRCLSRRGDLPIWNLGADDDERATMEVARDTSARDSQCFE